MNKNLKKLILAAIFAGISVVGSMVSIPVFGSKCAPVQHIINVMCAIFLGPWYGVGIAFCTSLIRNLLGTGTLLAFPGSMIGALCCGLVYKHTGKLTFTYIAEVIGTGVLGGLLAYPVAAFIMGKEVALFVYVVPFLVSTIGGTVIAAVLITILKANHTLEVLQNMVKEGKVKG